MVLLRLLNSNSVVIEITTTMIPPLSGLQILYFHFLFLPMRVFCKQKMQRLGHTLERTLGYDFNIPLEIGNVLIWKVSANHKPFTPLQYNEEDVQLGSDETYLVLTQKYVGVMTVYYWLGTHTLLINRQVSAKYAVLLAEFLKSVPVYKADGIRISREIQGMESDSFQHTIKMFNKCAGPRKEDDNFTHYLDANFPSPRPNLYVIRGSPPEIKKIPLSLGLQWLMANTICLLLEVEYKFEDMFPMHYFCDTENEAIIKKLIDFIPKFSAYFDNGYERNIHAVENNRNSEDFKQFLEVLEDIRNYNHYEVDYSNDHLKDAAQFVISRVQEISVFEVSSDGSKFETRNLDDLISTTAGYLLDLKSVTGTFLNINNVANINARVKAVELAEEYMDNTYPLSLGQIMKMRIMSSMEHSYLL